MTKAKARGRMMATNSAKEKASDSAKTNNSALTFKERLKSRFRILAGWWKYSATAIRLKILALPVILLVYAAVLYFKTLGELIRETINENWFSYFRHPVTELTRHRYLVLAFIEKKRRRFGNNYVRDHYRPTLPQPREMRVMYQVVSRKIKQEQKRGAVYPKN